MASLLPETPGRGRSRYSKALPAAPREASPKIASEYQHSPLPPLPKDAMPAAIIIPRRPVGVDKVGRAKAPSVSASLSSTCSESPGLSDGSDSSDSNSNSDEGDSLSGVDSEASVPPPLPPKRSQRRQDTSPPKTPPKTPPKIHILAQPLSGYTISPSPTQLWKRRSVKSDRSINFSDLKLSSSNGATAWQEQQSMKKSLPSNPLILPRSTVTGLRKKPVPSRPAPPQPLQLPTDSLMGAQITKIKEKASRGRLNEFAIKDEGAMPQPDRLAAQQKTIPSVQVPASTYLKSEPTDSETTLSASQTPPLPRRSDSRPSIQSTGPISRPTTKGSSIAVTLLPSVSITTSEDINEYFTTPSHSRDTSETLTITSEPVHKHSPQPQKPGTVAKILTPQPSPSPSATSPKSITSPLNLNSPAKITFPAYPGPLALPGAVLPGPPLSTVQLNCYQSHRFMRNTRNNLCPVACMVCQREDREQRWRCSWCCLSACGSCMGVLAQIPGKDLNIALDKIERKLITA